MRHLRYWGEYLSNAGVLWRVELHQRGAFVPMELGFPAEPLTIEWSCEGGKMGNLHKSAATLRIISDTDRRFTDLYQVEVGAVLLKVYRNGALYWSGTLDTELYEEPYAYLDGYDVTLTFSDFAPLDRIKWSEIGFVTIEQIVTAALDAASIQYTELRTHISTSIITDGMPIELSDIELMSANFYDEQDEPMSLLEVLEETLKPLALHMIQKSGRIVIFDTNALYALDTHSVEWASTDAALSTDETYNDVTVNFSPYGNSKILSVELEEDTTASDATESTLIKVDYDKYEFPPDGFSIYVGDRASSDLTLLNNTRYFRIKSDFSGSDGCGIVKTAQTHKLNATQPEYVNIAGLGPSEPVYRDGVVTSRPIIKCPPKALYVAQSIASNYKLKISLELLFDVRYNPFEQASESNERGNWDKMQNWCNFGYVPVILDMVDVNGTAMYHYDNSLAMLQDRYDQGGTWKSGAGAFGDCWLAYYDEKDRRSSSGFGGWAKNKPCIGYYQGELPSKLTILGDGQFIQMPPVSGFIRMTVGSGIHQFDYKREEKNIHPYVRWVMYRNPSIEVVKKNSRKYEVEDVEYRAWINRNAREDLKIDTIVGTLTEGSPTARGQMLTTARTPIVKLSRAGVYDCIEKLLIGTAYSAYASRSNILSGTVRSIPEFTVCSDASIAGKYLVISEFQRTWDDESEIEMVEFTADNYEGIEYGTV